MNEQDTRTLYLLYGVSEWPEKCQIMTASEKLEVLKDLKEGKNTPLAKLVKMPFPFFARQYFSQFPVAEGYFKYPAFAYKIYFMENSELRCFTEMMRNPHLTYKQLNELLRELYGYRIVNYHNFNLEYISQMDLEDLSKTMSSTRKSKTHTLKFLQLTDYINREEAEKMSLSVADIFVKDGVEGYDLEYKLSILNPEARRILEQYLGIHGYRPHGIAELKKSTVVPTSETIDHLIDTIVPKLYRSPKEFAHFIGFREEKQIPGNIFEYSSEFYRKIDISLETYAYVKNANSAEKEILASLKRKKKILYIAAKHMFKTPESLARNMGISLVDAKNHINRPLS